MNRFEPRIEVAVARVRSEVARLHKLLVRSGLSTWSSGVVSGRVPDSELFVIRPSGLDHSELAPDNMVLVDLEGHVVEGTPGAEFPPSRGVQVHADLYRRSPEIGGIAHTHSPFATAFALRGEAVPVLSTTAAAEFGGPIPVLAYAGPEVVDAGTIAAALDSQPSRAVLLERHGAYVVGTLPRDAVRAALLLEDSARAVQLARSTGSEIPPLDASDVAAIHERRLRLDAQNLDAQRVAELATAGSFPTSRPGIVRSGGEPGSWTTPVSNGITPDNDVRTTQ